MRYAAGYKPLDSIPSDIGVDFLGPVESEGSDYIAWYCEDFQDQIDLYPGLEYLGQDDRGDLVQAGW